MARRLGGAALSSLPLLLSPAEASSLARSRPVSFLDASWHMPGSPRKAHAEYTTGPRIPNAAFFDVDKVATVPYRVPARSEVADAQGLVSLPHMLPTPDRFGRALADLGVPEHAHIVAYDSVGVFSAPRLVWECQVMGRSASLLNGGLPRWIAEGHTVEDGPPRPASAGNSPTPERVQASALAEHVASYEDMVSNAASKEVDRAEILDARSTERFTGKAPEPRPGLPSGHIPLSRSLPFTALLGPESATDPPFRTLLPPAQLDRVFAQTFGVEVWSRIKAGDKAVVTTCGSGMTASVLWLGLAAVGVKRLRLYDESWTGYASRRDSVVAVGIQ